MGHPAQPPAEAGSPRAGCTGPCPGGSWISPEKEAPQPPWAACASAPSPSEGRSSSSCSAGASSASVCAHCPLSCRWAPLERVVQRDGGSWQEYQGACEPLLYGLTGAVGNWSQWEVLRRRFFFRLAFFFFSWIYFPGVYDLTAVMSHRIKVAARRRKNIVYTKCRMSWSDAAYGNTNKSAVWLMVWNLALYLYRRTYVLLEILTSKTIYYHFICRSKTRWGRKILLVLSTCVEFCSNIRNDGLREEECFSLSEVLKYCLKPVIYK